MGRGREKLTVKRRDKMERGKVGDREREVGRERGRVLRERETERGREGKKREERT